MPLIVSPIKFPCILSHEDGEEVTWQNYLYKFINGPWTAEFILAPDTRDFIATQPQSATSLLQFPAC